MSKKIPKALCDGILKLGEAKLPCAVLEDGTRVLSESGIALALGSRSGGTKKAKKEIIARGGAPLPIFISPKGLKPFINNELNDGLKHPMLYTQGNSEFVGFNATCLPEICDVWLKARDAGALQPQQQGRAQKADILMRGLAHIGIIALIDEVTGYQELRSKKALAEILEKFIDKELQSWTKTFPESFYKEIFRLREWSYTALAEGQSPKRPSVIGKYTNDLVYQRLAPGIYEELQKNNPKLSSGGRKVHHHRWFTPEYGHPKLSAHIEAITALAKASTTWDQFKRMVARAYPKRDTTIPFDFDGEE